MYSYGKAIL